MSDGIHDYERNMAMFENDRPTPIQIYRLPNGDYQTFPRGELTYTGEDARILDAIFKYAGKK